MTMKVTIGSGCLCYNDVFMKVKGITSTAVSYIGGLLTGLQK